MSEYLIVRSPSFGKDEVIAEVLADHPSAALAHAGVEDSLYVTHYAVMRREWARMQEAA